MRPIPCGAVTKAPSERSRKPQNWPFFTHLECLGEWPGSITPFLAGISKLAWSPPFLHANFDTMNAKKSPILADFAPVFQMSFANPPLCPSRGHAPKKAVLSAFFEDPQLRAATANFSKKPFSTFFARMAWSFCPFFASKKDNLACTGTATPNGNTVAPLTHDSIERFSQTWRRMQTGIIGLAQTGKTSLFRILTGARVESRAQQPGQAHVGIARVPDARVAKLAELFQPKKITYAQVEFVDIGGMTAEKQKDRARDSASLVPLREADALIHVVRLFEDPSVPHPSGAIDAMRDIESVEIELMLNDLEQATKRLERVEKDLKKKRDPQAEMEKNVLERCVKSLEAETPLRELELKPDEQKLMNGFMFVSRKPMLFALNLGDEDAADM